MSGDGGPLGNRSSAVMQQRRHGDRRAVEGRRGRDVAPPQLNYFPTPPWATRALCEFLVSQGIATREMVCWEPACGEMHMVRPLEEYFFDVVATDVHRYGDDHDLFDFTLAPFGGADREAPDFVITNPPFTLATDFIAAASRIAQRGFAMLVRSAFLEGGERFRSLWSANPPSFVLQFSERVVMLENRLIQAGAIDPFSADEKDHRARSATAYVWLLWLDGEPDTRFRWIGPCRDRLERPSDYPDYGVTRESDAPLLGAAA